MDFFDVRVRFKKQGSARFISHLDLQRFIQRVLKRTGLPIWHTEGFNPHPYVTFALPLSLGQVGLLEVMDFRLTQFVPAKDILLALQKCLTEDICVVSVSEPKHKSKEIAYAHYNIIMRNSASLLSSLKTFLEQDKIITVKKTKKSTAQLDLMPLILNPEIKDDGNNLVLDVILPAGSELNINPSLLLTAFSEYCSCDLSSAFVVRSNILRKDLSEFK